MNKRILLILAFAVALFACGQKDKTPLFSSSRYEDLVSLFNEWRKFQAPEMNSGIPDYSPGAMKKQYSELTSWKAKLAAIDTSGWPIKHQADWYLVWAEMNGLDFDHRVVQPWVRDPAFYVWFYPSPSDVPEREGPNIEGAIELPQYPTPLSPKDAAEIAARLRKAPAVFESAKNNLTGNARDLWVRGIESFKQQSQDLLTFSTTVAAEFPDLSAAAIEARKASDQFAAWLSEQAAQKTGISGVGKENYSWNLRNVHLMPYDYDDYKILLERELSRSHAALRLTEHRNRKLPRLERISNAADYDTIMHRGVSEFMDFLKGNEIMTVKDYMEPAMMGQVGKFQPTEGLRGFFAEIDYRNPMPMRCHQFHWIDKAMNRLEPVESPIRQKPLLYNIFDSRAEGLATAMEELMWQAGLYANKPRAEELVWIMLADRAARGLGGLYQHGQEMNFDEATRYSSKWVPWGLLPADGETIQWEEHFYLQQPGYEASYLTGKMEIDRLIAEYSRQREGSFVMKTFMDEFLRKGIIPISLIYWEMTGDKSILNRAVEGKK